MMTDLRFDGSAWCNIDIALHSLDLQYKLALEEHNLSPIQAYILWSLLKTDKQRPSDLASSVGRVATSFTPILDSLEQRHLLERKLSLKDRRSVLIHLTPEGKKLAKQASQAIQRVDEKLADSIGVDNLPAFLNVLAILQAPEKLKKDQTAKNFA